MSKYTIPISCDIPHYNYNRQKQQKKRAGSHCHHSYTMFMRLWMLTTKNTICSKKPRLSSRAHLPLHNRHIFKTQFLATLERTRKKSEKVEKRILFTFVGFFVFFSTRGPLQKTIFLKILFSFVLPKFLNIFN